MADDDDTAENHAISTATAEAPAIEDPAPVSEELGVVTAEPAEAATQPEPEPAVEPEPEVTEPEPEPEPVSAEAVATPEGEGEEAAVVAEPPAEPPPPESKKKWYVIKVTSNREESIKAAIERRVKVEGLEEFFGQIVIPVERTTIIKKVKETKKFPGYLMAEVEFNDQILYLFRETSGVGDFVGSSPGKPPAPMLDRDVQSMLGNTLEPDAKGAGGKKVKAVVKLDFEKGDKVRVREGAFANMEGEVKVITDPKDTGETPKVTVEVMIFGRGVPVELDYWQVDKV